MIGSSLYTWSIVVTAFLLVGALHVLGSAITGLLLDRLWIRALVLLMFSAACVGIATENWLDFHSYYGVLYRCLV